MSEKIRELNGPVPNNLKQILKKNNKKQIELARSIGVPKQRITDIIAGRRIVYAAELVKIAAALEVTPNELLGVDRIAEILVTKGNDNEVIASITCTDVLVKEGYEVTFR